MALGARCDAGLAVGSGCSCSGKCWGSSNRIELRQRQRILRSCVLLLTKYPPHQVSSSSPGVLLTRCPPPPHQVSSLPGVLVCNRCPPPQQVSSSSPGVLLLTRAPFIPKDTLKDIFISKGVFLRPILEESRSPTGDSIACLKKTARLSYSMA
ncbi:hypothetical protein TREES_T100015682 [Tupaia chinensis]|uniref:Uncharacterized protein n=1 Tax=Tupaia chinensis TaxID=246437 RepID=L9LB98_TUPCH|nr:hypothetical protein TREES_T100015682 [Tupaia chinensis]